VALIVDVVRAISMSPYGQISRLITLNSSLVPSDMANGGAKNFSWPSWWLEGAAYLTAKWVKKVSHGCVLPLLCSPVKLIMEGAYLR